MDDEKLSSMGFDGFQAKPMSKSAFEALINKYKS
jgi:hypothetical protein